MLRIFRIFRIYDDTTTRLMPTDVLLSIRQDPCNLSHREHRASSIEQFLKRNLVCKKSFYESLPKSTGRVNIVESSDGAPDHGKTYSVHVGGAFSKTCKLHRDGDSVHQTSRRLSSTNLPCFCHWLSQPSLPCLFVQSATFESGPHVQNMGCIQFLVALFFTARKGNVQWPVVLLIR